jgi:cytochrome b561
MSIRSTSFRWGAVAQSLHWIIVVLIIVQVVLATVAEDLPLPKKVGVYAWHKSFGITILGLAVIRLLWRWSNPTPALPATLKPHERVLAHVTHVGLYVLLFAQPLTGWMMTSARGFPASWFGFLFPAQWAPYLQLPDFVPKNNALYNAMKETHDTLALALYAIVLLHVAAALKHHFLLKDDVLRRMLPFTKKP